MALVILLALQALLCVALVFMWRRTSTLRAEVAELRAALEARAVTRGKSRRAAGEVVPLAPAEEALPVSRDPNTRAARAWGLTETAIDNFSLRGPTLSPETGRGLTLALMAVAPALAFFFNGDPAAIVASGLAIASAMMLIALRPIWRSAAWAGVFTASAWALIGFALGAAHADPVSYSICVAFAACAGLAHAHLRRATPGATMALAMAAAVLALGSQVGMVSAAGAGFGVIVAAAAIVGAMSLRLEAMHLAAFGASVIALFVLSGQASAAIWFTPAAAWTGALFFAIAVVRVPQLGPRGVALAGTGAFAPLGAVAALHAAQHGLANHYAAAAVYLALAGLLAGLIALAALRRPNGLQALRLTLWVLTLGAFCALSAAFSLALPAPFAALAFAATAFGLSLLDLRLPNAAWRSSALAAGALSVLFAVLAARALLGETTGVWPWLAIVAGFGLSAALLGAAAFAFARNKATSVAAIFELIAIALGIAGLDLLARLIFSNGAMRLYPASLGEVGVHATLWLGAALALAWRAHLGATSVRAGAANLLTAMALATMAIAGALWTMSFWQAAPIAPLRDTLGFLAPSIFFFAHWLFWRRREAELKTRACFAAAAALLAAVITIEVMRLGGLPNWVAALTGAASFALAVGLNFAPGVTAAQAPVKPRGRFPLKAAPPAARSDAASAD